RVPHPRHRGVPGAAPSCPTAAHRRHHSDQRHAGPLRDGPAMTVDVVQPTTAVWWVPLRHAPFRFLASGRLMTMLGNAVAPIALAFAVLDVTGSARDLGLVVAARSTTMAVFLLFGGVVADRLPRHLVLVGSGIAAG